MDISIFGLGYVGCVTAGCLAERGHRIIAVDVAAAKVDLVNAGRSPIIEAEIEQLIASNVTAGRLLATMDAEMAVAESELSIVCVGTPSRANGSLDTQYLQRACRQIGACLGAKNSRHVVTIRSTMLPGVGEGTILPLLTEASHKRCPEDFGFCVHPEFLREATAVDDFRNPPKIVIGATDEASGRKVADMYEGMTAPLIFCRPDEASMVKYADNCFHAVKIVFANEIGSMARALGMDGRVVLDVFCRDTKLNISAAYLKPGFAYGGSCLPKDVRAICHAGRDRDVSLPMLESLAASNAAHIQRLLDEIYALGTKRVGILGLSFKAGTDDMRESPVVRVVETLIGKGYDVAIRDPYVSLARLSGSNKDFLERTIPHIAKLLKDCAGDVVAASEAVVVTYRHDEFDEALEAAGENKKIVDVSCVGVNDPLYPRSLRIV